MSLARFAAFWWLPLVLVLTGPARPALSSTWTRIGPEGTNVHALAEDTAQMAGGPKWRPPADDDRLPVRDGVCGLAAANSTAS